MRFLLIIPRYISKMGEYYIFPMGLAYISSSLKEKGYHVECLNLNHYDEPVPILIKREIIGKEIDVVCTGGLSIHFNKIKDIFDIARKIKPDIVTIIGGGLLSSEPTIVMQALQANFGVIGEGEETIVELADAIANSKNYNNVKGIIYFENSNKDTPVATSQRAPISNIDCIPFPDYEGLDSDKHLSGLSPNDERDLYPFDNPRRLPMISSRSCPYACTFCYHPIGRIYRQRSLDNFFEEVNYIVDRYKINMLAILDELFAHDQQRLKEFCSRLFEYNLKWIAQIRVNIVDKEILDMMKKSGCYCISYGLESASNTILKSMKKFIKLLDIEKALKLTSEAGIGIQGNFLFGDTAETLQTAIETLEWWLKHREYQIYMVPVEVYPGTELYHYAVAKGLIKDKLKFLEEKCPTLNLTEMSDDKYRQLLLIIYFLLSTYQLIPAQVSLCIPKRNDSYGRRLYYVEIICPHCHNLIKYDNILLNGHLKIGCRVCNQRFDMSLGKSHLNESLICRLAMEYSFSVKDIEEIKEMLYRDSNNWGVEKFLLGKYIIAKLLGKYYGIFKYASLDDIRYHRLPIIIGKNVKQVKVRIPIYHIIYHIKIILKKSNNRIRLLLSFLYKGIQLL